MNDQTTIQCHCLGRANKYFTKHFINGLNQKTTRTFYRCENCWSRISKDTFPELENSTISIFDLIKQHNKK